MKIAFYSYPSAFQNPGGGEIQLLKTRDALQMQGVEVKLFDQWHDRLESFDILHVFGSVKDCLGLMHTARNKKVKIALSPIFWSSFKRAFFESAAPVRRSELILRHLTKLALPTFPSSRRKMMLISDILLPNSDLEAKQLQRLFFIPKEMIHVVPNGVDEKFRRTDPEFFKVEYGFRDFVLAVGRIEPRKNQLNLIKAIQHTDKKLVIIGDPVSDYLDYYQECKDTAGGKQVFFVGGINHADKILISAYAACDLFIAPGWFETPGLAALEAGIAGAKIAVTKYGCTKEYFSDMAEYFDPSNIKDIVKAINSAYARPKTSVLQEHIIANYTWQKVAAETIAAYQKILVPKGES